MSSTYHDRLQAANFEVRSVPLADAKEFMAKWHYSKGCSNTAVYCFGLFHKCLPFLYGATVWLPPTKNAAASVEPERWRQVLALSRMAVHKIVPKNACTFMLSRAVRAIQRERRFVALVTFADEWQEHEGGVYRAAGWEYVGRVGPYPKWIDPVTGRQVATQATRTRRRSEMESLGYQQIGSFHKHKFVRRLVA